MSACATQAASKVSSALLGLRRLHQLALPTRVDLVMRTDLLPGKKASTKSVDRSPIWLDLPSPT